MRVDIFRFHDVDNLAVQYGIVLCTKLERDTEPLNSELHLVQPLQP